MMGTPYLDLVGRPYKPKGRSIDGFDCAGVVLEFLRRAGFEIPEHVFESPEPTWWVRVGDLAEIEPLEGDVVFSRPSEGGLHADVILGTKPPLALTSCRQVGSFCRRPLSIENPLGVYRLRP